MRISRQLSPVQITIDQKQPEDMQYFNYLGNMITNDARRIHEIKPRITRANAAFNKKKPFPCSKLDWNLRQNLAKCYIWATTLYGAEILTRWKVDKKCLERSEMCCWSSMEKIRWTDRLRNEDELYRGKE